jgi:hypothetical protein
MRYGHGAAHRDRVRRVGAGSLGRECGRKGRRSVSMAFWFQLAFMRLFGTALIGLGAILLWCHSHLTESQHSSLVKVLGVVLGALALMAVGQQIAIWNSNAGWALAGTLLLMAAACAVSTVREATGHAV